MWPKALTQLVELAPHITRLAPLADRFFKEKASGDAATRDVLGAHRAALDSQSVALKDLGSRLQADITGLRAAQEAAAAQAATQAATLQKQYAELDKSLASTRADALAAKHATESFQTRLERLEGGQRRAQALLIVALGLLLAIFALIATLFLRAH